MSKDITQRRGKGVGVDIKTPLKNHDNKVLAYFESPKNAKLFSSLFSLENIQCRYRNGKSEVVKAVEEAQKVESVAIGIIDADFERLRNPAISDCSISDIFWTDCHDTEMMILNSKETIEKVLSIYDQKIDAKSDQTVTKRAQFEDKHKKSIIDFIVEQLFAMSVLRFCKELNGWEINFRKSEDGQPIQYLTYSKFIIVDKKTATIKFDENNFLKHLETAFKNANSQSVFFAKDKKAAAKQIYENEKKKLFDFWELTNGHDVLHILSLSFEGVIANYTSSERITPDRLELDLMLAYTVQEFQKTNLYALLKDWEQKNGKNILKTT